MALPFRSYKHPMPISLDYNPEDGFVRATVTGAVTAEDFRAALTRLLDSDDMPSDAAMLYDMRQMDASRLNFSEGFSLLTYRRSIDSARGTPRIAFLVSTDVTFGMVRMWQNLVQGDPGMRARRRIFQDEADAVAWLQDSSTTV